MQRVSSLFIVKKIHSAASPLNKQVFDRCGLAEPSLWVAMELVEWRECDWAKLKWLNDCLEDNYYEDLD